MAITLSTAARRTLGRALAVLVVVLPALGAAATLPATAVAESAVVTSSQASQASQADVRTDIVSVTRWQLVNPRPYKVGGRKYNSQPNRSGGYNYLGRNGSNENRNIFNNYNGEPWCGHFVRWVWTKAGTVNAPIPANYASSQAWRTSAGSRWHAYSGTLPKPGDVLVWTNNGDASQGHVAVVTAVNTSRRAITYIGGNEWIAGNRDSIVQHSRNWSDMDQSMSGKTFRGFTSRF